MDDVRATAELWNTYATKQTEADAMDREIARVTYTLSLQRNAAMLEAARLKTSLNARALYYLGTLKKSQHYVTVIDNLKMLPELVGADSIELDAATIVGPNDLRIYGSTQVLQIAANRSFMTFIKFHFVLKMLGGGKVASEVSTFTIASEERFHRGG